MDERLVTGEASPVERGLEVSLRPQSFDEYVGQPTATSNLRVFVRAALDRGDSLDHVLLFGPPGLGKTTLAHVIANEMGASIRVTAGPVIERPGDLAAILTNLEPGDCLFIDEIHRLSSAVEEILYPALEDFKLDLVIGQGPSARTVRLDLPRFTLIGASTRIGLLTSPLRDRFGIVHHLEFYDEADILVILHRSAGLLGIEADAEGLTELARRARGTPRVANRLLRRVRDFAQVDGQGVITRELADHALTRLGVDSHGLDRVDRRLLGLIADKFRGGPVGLNTLSAAVGEDAGTIEDIYEPYLIMLGFLERTPRGRRVTAAAVRHLGLPNAGSAESGQGDLWGDA